MFKEELADGEVTGGKLEQTSHHMVEHKRWEEHANPAYHLRGIFAEPTRVQFTVNISAEKKMPLSFLSHRFMLCP